MAPSQIVIGFLIPPRKNPPLSVQQQERVSVVYSNTGKRISPVFSSVEKALMALGWPEVAVWTREKLVERMEDSPEVDG